MSNFDYYDRKLKQAKDSYRYCGIESTKFDRYARSVLDGALKSDELSHLEHAWLCAKYGLPEITVTEHNEKTNVSITLPKEV